MTTIKFHLVLLTRFVMIWVMCDICNNPNISKSKAAVYMVVFLAIISYTMLEFKNKKDD